MLDNTIFMGVNAPKPHQRIIGKLMTSLGQLFYREGKIPYEPFTETMIDEGKTSPTPDILLFDNESGQNVALIEVSTTAGAKKDFEKIIELVKDYDIREGFVYDYNKGKWMKYQIGKGAVSEHPSYCESIGYDLDDFLK